MMEGKHFCQLEERPTIGADGKGTDVPWKAEFRSEITNRLAHQSIHRSACRANMWRTFARPWPGSTTTNRQFHYSQWRSEVSLGVGGGGGGSIPGGGRHGRCEMERAWPPCHSAGFMFSFFFSFPSEGDGGGWGAMGGGRYEEKCDLPGPSATNGGFDLPAKSRCCYALFYF